MHTYFNIRWETCRCLLLTESMLTFSANNLVESYLGYWLNNPGLRTTGFLNACNSSSFRIDFRGQDHDNIKVKERRQAFGGGTSPLFRTSRRISSTSIRISRTRSRSYSSRSRSNIVALAGGGHPSLKCQAPSSPETTSYDILLAATASSCLLHSLYVRLPVCSTIRSRSFSSTNHKPALLTRIGRITESIVYCSTDMDVHVTLGHATRLTNSARFKCLFKGLDPSATSNVLIKTLPL